MDNFSVTKWNRERYIDENKDVKSTKKIQETYDSLISMVERKSKQLIMLLEIEITLSFW